jgi:hypothetical protein
MTNSIARNGPTPRAFDTIVYGGLIAGTLDAIDGVVAFGLKFRDALAVHCGWRAILKLSARPQLHSCLR